MPPPRGLSLASSLPTWSTARQLGVDLASRLHGEARAGPTRVKGGQPVLAEPVESASPALSVGHDGLIVQVALRTRDAEPPMHRRGPGGKGVELELHAAEPAEELARVGDKVKYARRDVPARVQRREAHAHARAVEDVPEIVIALGVQMRGSVRYDVEPAKRGRAGVECLLGEDHSMAVVVDICEAHPVLPISEDAQPAETSSFQHVGQEQSVAWTVHLVRSNCDGQQARAVARRSDRELAERLCLRVHLHVPLQRQLGEIIFAEAVKVAPVEAGARGRGHDHLADAERKTRLDDVPRAIVVDHSVELRRVERAHCRRDVPRTVCVLARLQNVVQFGDVALHVADSRVAARVDGARGNVKGKHTLGAPLHQHLAQSLADKARATGDDAAQRRARKVGHSCS
mmetsp:Transcript_39627/g.91762  ORF Transcript_39627/g.91762 Transcript_39627/m.91762 type:complete len:401 (-) Transcript_39627:417-1619(-)